MGLMKKLAAFIGLGLIAVSIANVELGVLMGLEPPQKVILSRLADPGCNSDEIQKDLDYLKHQNLKCKSSLSKSESRNGWCQLNCQKRDSRV